MYSLYQCADIILHRFLYNNLESVYTPLYIQCSIIIVHFVPPFTVHKYTHMYIHTCSTCTQVHTCTCTCIY